MNNMFDLTDRKAIVTGGTRGLGHGMAEGLMENGAQVVIFGSTERVMDVAAEFRRREGVSGIDEKRARLATAAEAESVVIAKGGKA